MKTLIILNCLSFLGVMFLNKLEWKFPFHLSLVVFVGTLYGMLYFVMK